MKEARSEARGCPRIAKFGAEIGGSLLAKKIANDVKKEISKLDWAKGCGCVPKDLRV